MSKGINFTPFSPLKVLYNPKAFFIHAAWLHRLAPIVQYSPLLPPVGVWTGLSSSVAGHPLRPARDRRLGSRYPTY